MCPVIRAMSDVYLYIHIHNNCVGQDGTVFIYSLSKVNKSEEKERDEDEDVPLSPVSQVTNTWSIIH